MLLGENSAIAGDAAEETNHRSPRPRSAARAMAGLLARGSTTDADLPGCPVIIGGVVLPLTVAGAATASALRPAPCSLLIPEGNHQGIGIGFQGRRQNSLPPSLVPSSPIRLRLTRPGSRAPCRARRVPWHPLLVARVGRLGLRDANNGDLLVLGDLNKALNGRLAGLRVVEHDLDLVTFEVIFESGDI